MRRSKRLHYRITNGRLTPFVALVIALLCWAVTGVSWFSGAGFLLSLLTAYLLVVQNNAFSIIRTRTSMQAVFYLLLVASTPLLHTVTAGSFTVIFLLLMSFFLLAAYQHPAPVMPLFYAFLFLGVGSILVPQLMFLLPFYWLTAFRFQALTLRSFCASIVGFLLPYWFLWGHAYFYGEMQLFYRPFQELISFDPFSPVYPLWLLATLGYVTLLFLICGIHYLVASNEDKLRTRSFLQFFFGKTFLLLLYIGLQPDRGELFLPFLYVGISVLCAHYFVLSNSRSANLFFLLVAVGWLLLCGFNLWLVI